MPPKAPPKTGEKPSKTPSKTGQPPLKSRSKSIRSDQSLAKGPSKAGPNAAKTGSQPNLMLPNATPQQPVSAIPPNRLAELNLNDIAVEIRNLKFTYTKSKGYLFDNFSLTFPRGAIYGFLGPSGCGKTTLTKLIVGLLKPMSGSVKVHGRPIQDPANLIPGPGVGYMPQDTSLWEEFSIYETLHYFSEIYGLPKSERNERIKTLIQFLDLPDQERKVAVLSGGQKRRTSLAVAIIHSPPLLIMDEPTVGIDPLMREKIWQHLLELSSKEKTSIMITTHYIEECHRAHVIGLMRSGKLLAENSPHTLLTHYNTTNLEEVFLQICIAAEAKGASLPPNLEQMQKESGATRPVEANVKLRFRPNRCSRIYCLFLKNIRLLCRNLLLLYMEVLLPMIALILFSLAVGNKPFGLDLALYSEERLNQSVPRNATLSESYLDELDKDTFKLVDYKSATEADKSVADGVTYGALHVGPNFTSALLERMQLQTRAPDSVVQQSTIPFKGDLSDIALYQTMLIELYEAMGRFVVKLMMTMAAKLPKDTTLNPKILTPTVNLTEPIYGTKNVNFRDFLYPSFLMMTAFIISMAMTALNMIQERMKGLLDRSLVAGAKLEEILASLVIIQSIVLIIQIFANLVVTLLIFDYYNKGEYHVIYEHVFLQGLCGICLGVAISMTFHDMDMAIIMVAGIMMPLMVISGIVWPIEAMDDWVRYVAYPLPQTMPIKALRAVIHKGWSYLDNKVVAIGAAVSILWSSVFFIYSILITWVIK